MKRVSNSALDRSRLRLREPRQDRERAIGDAVPWEQVRLFSGLLVSEGEQGGYAAPRLDAKAPANLAMLQALAEQLAPRIQAGTHWPLQAVLYLPRLGRINATVRREQGAWNIELQAQEDDTVRWLGSVRQRCQHRFSEALGQPVNLHLITVASS